MPDSMAPYLRRIRSDPMKELISVFVFLMGLIVFSLGHFTSQAGDSVKVAAVFSLSGEYAEINTPDLAGLRFGIEEINARGGLLGRKINLLVIDNQSTAIGSKKAAEQAVREGVIAVIGAALSSHSLAMAGVLQTSRTPMITPESTHPDITRTGDYIFRVCFIDDFQGLVMAEFARSDLKAKKAVVLTNTASVYSLNLAKAFIRQFSGRGGAVLWEGDYLMGSTDLVSMLSRVKSLKPDCVFLPGYVDDSAQIIKLARDKGITTPFLGGDGWDDLMYRTAGKALNGCYYLAQWHKESTGERSLEFVKAWEKNHGKVESPWIAPAYDAAMLLADAVKRAGSLDKARIRDALASTRGFRGVTGEITMDGNRNPVNKPAIILRFDHGTSAYVRTIRP